MSDLLGHAEPHYTGEGLCECRCAECRGRTRHVEVKVGRKVRQVIEATCICRGCAHNFAGAKR